MNTNNPTELRIGMSGQLFDRTHRICGRVVLSTEISGEHYIWQEFFLKSDAGEEGTLVFEETESGPVWRYFEFFEPQNPLSVIDASRISEGSTIKIDDFSGTVDFIGTSTVRAIEGEAPEGVEKGDYSQYFNATGKNTLVVSWANGEVEHYIGQTIPRGMVRSAFKAELPNNYTAALQSTQTKQSSGPSSGFDFSQLKKFALIAVVAVVAIFQFLPSCERRGKRPSTRPPPAIQLDQTKAVTLQGRPHRIVSSAIIEYATAGSTRLARLYELTDTDNVTSQLLQGVENDPKQWTLLDGLTSHPVTALTPKQLGALKKLAIFSIDGRTYRVADFFRIRVVRCELGTPNDFPLGKIRYGLISESSTGRTLVDWDEEVARLNKPVNLTDINVSQ